MCGIAGFCDYHDTMTDEAPLWGALAKRMGNRLSTGGLMILAYMCLTMRLLPMHGLPW